MHLWRQKICTWLVRADLSLSLGHLFFLHLPQFVIIYCQLIAQQMLLQKTLIYCCFHSLYSSLMTTSALTQDISCMTAIYLIVDSNDGGSMLDHHGGG